MKTEVEMGSAITVLNGIGLGIGSTIGLAKEHKIILEDHDKLEYELSQNADKKLINSCLSTFEQRFDISIDKVKVTTSLQFPPSKGLKTSSIVATGLIKALSNKFQIDVTDEEIVNLGASASIDAGVSLTGAIDDAWASLKGGFYVTHNLDKRILAHHKISIEKEVILLIPDHSNLKSEINLELNFLDKYVLEQVYQDALNANWKSAIQKNSRVYAQFFLEDWDLINSLDNLVNGTVGLNGTGPSLFVICNQNQTERNLGKLEREFTQYNLHTTKLRT